MGKNHPGFHQAVIEILKNHLEDFEETEIKIWMVFTMSLQPANGSLWRSS